MTNNTMDTNTHQLLEKMLGRNVQANEQGGVESFLDFTDTDLKEFRILSSRNIIITVAYIRYRLKGKTSLRAAASYCDMVVRNGISVEEWINECMPK